MKLVGVEELGDINPKVFKTFAIDNLLNYDRRKQIVYFLNNPTRIVDQIIRYMALSYIIMGNELFKKTHEGFFIKCLSENEAYLAIFSAHSGSCRAHHAGHTMKWLLF